jgi:hypothetical protein
VIHGPSMVSRAGRPSRQRCMRRTDVGSESVRASFQHQSVWFGHRLKDC